MPRPCGISSTILHVYYSVATGIIDDNDQSDWHTELSETIKWCVTAGINAILIYIYGVFLFFVI